MVLNALSGLSIVLIYTLPRQKDSFFPVIFCNVMCNVVQKNVLNSKFLKSLDCSGRSKGTTNVL